jgi:hypothetical protein
MCISLRLKTNKVGSIFFWSRLLLHLKMQLNTTACCFADIISLRRRHNSLGPIRVIGEYLVDLKFYLNKISDLMLTYGGIRALNISNLAASAYGLSLGFL